MFLGSKIWKRLNKYSSWMTGRIHAKSLRENTLKMIAPYGANVRIILQKSIPNRGWFMVGGEFDPSLSKNSITIDVHIREDKGYIYFTEEKRQKYIFLLNQTLQHELVHKSQFASRGTSNFYTHHYYFTPGSSKKSAKMMKYLAMVEEIDAYAHDLAMEIKYFYPFEDPKQVLKQVNNYSDLVTWKIYSRAFKKARWPQVRNELLRKTYKWLPKINENFI